MKAKTMIDQKNILIVTALAVVLVFCLGMFIPLIYIGVIVPLLAGILVGYLVNNSFKVGAVHGALVGLFTAIIYVLVVYAYFGFSEKIVVGLIIIYLILIPAFILFGLAGGIIGFVIKASRNRGQILNEDILDQNDDEEDEEQ